MHIKLLKGFRNVYRFYCISYYSDGIIDPLIPLNLAKYLKKEKEYIPWAMARSKLDCITILISDKKLKRLYKVRKNH